MSGTAPVVAEVTGRTRLVPWLDTAGFADCVVIVALLSALTAYLAFYYANTPLRLTTVGLQVSLFIFMMIASPSRNIGIVSVLLFAAAMPIAIVNSSATEFKSLMVPLSFLGGVGSAWYTVEYRKSKYVYEWPFYVFLATTVYLIVVRGYGSQEFNEILAGGSRNGYSAMLVAVTCAYLISRHFRGKKASSLLVGVAFLCSIPLYGRSSIVVLGAIFVMMLARRWPRTVALLSLLLAFAAYQQFALLSLLADLDTNFKYGLVSDRWSMLSDYLAAINPKTLMLGVDFDDILSIRENDGSPDIAYLRLHSYIGFASLLFLYMYVWSGAAALRRRQWFIFSILVAVLVRASTDIIYMFGTLDFLFMPVLLYQFFADLAHVRR